MATSPKKEAPITGVKEWAVASFNCVVGCPNNCRYCYARDIALRRFHRVASIEEWGHPRLRPEKIREAKRYHKGGVMFPTTHDIVPETLSLCLEALETLLAAGNRVLVVSKPRIICIRAVCERFAAYATPDSKLSLRFTIGAESDEILSFWEPGAPAFAERFECLKLAHGLGFSTSVSMEPLLDPANAAALAFKLLPFVTDTLWLGLMNQAKSRCVFESAAQAKHLEALLATYASKTMEELYGALKGEEKVRWKYELRQRLGI